MSQATPSRPKGGGDTFSDVFKNPKFCAKCGVAGCELKCPCKQGYYCSKECQKEHWPTHKKECSIVLAKKVKAAKKEHGKEDTSVGDACMRAGIGHTSEGRYREAEKYYLEARRVYVATLEADDEKIADCYFQIGQLYELMGEQGLALESLAESLGIYRRIEGEKSGNASKCLSVMGRSLTSQGMLEEAMVMLKEAHGIFREIAGPEHVSTARLLGEMGKNYYLQGDMDMALEMFTENLRVHRMRCGNESEDTAIAMTNLSGVLEKIGEMDKARDLLEESLAIYRRLHGEKHPMLGAAFNNIASLFSKQGKDEEALKLHRKALKIYRRTFGEDHAELAAALYNTATTLGKLGMYDEAVQNLQEALDNFTGALGVDNGEAIAVHQAMSLAKRESGDMAGALESARECLRLLMLHEYPEHFLQSGADLVRELEEMQ